MPWVKTPTGKILVPEFPSPGDTTARVLKGGAFSPAEITDVSGLSAALGALMPTSAILSGLSAMGSGTGLVEQTGAATFAKRAMGVGAGTSIPTLSDADARYAAISHSHSVFSSVADGMAPASGGGTVNFLRADGTWAAPSGGGGGAIQSGTATVDFGTGDTTASVTLTGLTWVTASSRVMITPVAGGDHPSVEEALIEQLHLSASDIVPGVGFTIRAHAPNKTNGSYAVHYLGVP